VVFRRRFNAKKEENPMNKSLKFPANMSFRNHIEDGIPGIAKKSAASNNRGASLPVTSMLLIAMFSLCCNPQARSIAADAGLLSFSFSELRRFNSKFTINDNCGFNSAVSISFS
jgi:hypothetical protein